MPRSSPPLSAERTPPDPTPRRPPIRLGFAVKAIGAPGGALRSNDTRRHQNDPSLGVSISYLHQIFDYLDEAGIRMYRMSSDLAPYATHPDYPQFRDQPERFDRELRELGDRANNAKLRLSFHPGQYTVLNSTREEVVRAAQADLEVQAEILDRMGLPEEAVIVLHIGGGAQDPTAALDRFERGFEGLSPAAQSRLVIENDDRLFDTPTACELARRIGRPLVWDALHHFCHDPQRVSAKEALAMSLATWPKSTRPKIHYSSPRLGLEDPPKPKRGEAPKPPRAEKLSRHSDLIDPLAFCDFLQHTLANQRASDVMLESKGKDISLTRLTQQLATRGATFCDGWLEWSELR